MGIAIEIVVPIRYLRASSTDSVSWNSAAEEWSLALILTLIPYSAPVVYISATGVESIGSAIDSLCSAEDLNRSLEVPRSLSSANILQKKSNCCIYLAKSIPGIIELYLIILNGLSNSVQVFVYRNNWDNGELSTKLFTGASKKKKFGKPTPLKRVLILMDSFGQRTCPSNILQTAIVLPD